MARYRTKPINPFLHKLMDERGWKTLKEAADATGMPVQTLTVLADIQDSNQVLECHAKAAKQFGLSLDEWVKGLLGRETVEAR